MATKEQPTSVIIVVMLVHNNNNKNNNKLVYGPLPGQTWKAGTRFIQEVTINAISPVTSHQSSHRPLKFRYLNVDLKPNSITLASSELAPNMFEAGSCQIPLH